MALIFNPVTDNARPLLHALIVGIDHYPYLGPVESAARKLPPLDNLFSPSISANALADWLLTHQSWLCDAKLGSIDLITAPVPSGPQAAPLSAKTQDIATAFGAWFDRCNQNPDNIALFYFCGHGLQKDNVLLLPEDFGQIKNCPWANAIDFDASYRGMSTCAAQTQCFIIDACRQWSRSIVQDLNASGVALLRADLRDQRPRLAPKLYGTAAGLAAFGDTSGRPSRLARSIIACLEGKAAVKENGEWKVTVEGLGPAVRSLINLENRSLSSDDRQIVDPTLGEAAAENRTLVVLPNDVHPKALVEFDCVPNEASKHAQFYHEGICPVNPPCSATCKGPWSVELRAGIYDCGASIIPPSPRFVSKRLSGEIIHPPVRQVRVSVA